MKNFRAHILVLLSEVIWGLSAPVAKALMMQSLNGFQLVQFRIIGAFLLFWITSLFCKKEKIDSKDYWRIIVCGLLAIAINQTLFTVGLSITSPVNATIMTTTMPLLTMFLAFFILKEPISWKKSMGIALGAAGVMLIILHSHDNPSDRNGNVFGDFLIIIAQFCFALYLNLSKPILQRYSGITFYKWMFTASVAVTIWFIPCNFQDFQWTSHSLDFWLGLAFVVIFATYLSYILFMYGQKILRPTVASIYNYVQPIVACLVSVAVGLGVFGMIHTAAVIMVIVGVILVAKSKSRADQLKELKDK